MMSTPRKKLPDVQVLIPYKTLQELLMAAAVAEENKKEILFLREQFSALRFQFTELMEVFHEYQD